MINVPFPKIAIPSFVAKFIKENVCSFVMERIGSLVDEAVTRKVYETSEKENKREFEKQVRNASVHLEIQNGEAVIQQALRVYDATLAILKDIQQTRNGYINITIYGDVNIYQYNAKSIAIINSVDEALTNTVVDDVMNGFYDIISQDEKPLVCNSTGSSCFTSDNEVSTKQTSTPNSPKQKIRDFSNRIWNEQQKMIRNLRSED